MINEEEIEEIKDIDQVRRRFPNTMPNFLKGGNWTRDSPWWRAGDKGKRGCMSLNENIWSW